VVIYKGIDDVHKTSIAGLGCEMKMGSSNSALKCIGPSIRCQSMDRKNNGLLAASDRQAEPLFHLLPANRRPLPSGRGMLDRHRRTLMLNHNPCCGAAPPLSAGVKKNVKADAEKRVRTINDPKAHNDLLNRNAAVFRDILAQLLSSIHL
jgi:hypothetical protein